MVAAVAADGVVLAAVAVQAGAHGVRGLGIGGGVAFLAGDAAGSVLAVVEMDGSRQGGFAYPLEGFAGVGGMVRIDGCVQGEQARVVGEDVAVTVQASAGRGQAGGS